jgi:GH24 family phage-related lysozyme (muramidase)
MSIAQNICWHSIFSEGKTLVEDEQRGGRTSATWTGDNRARLRELVRSDRRLTIRIIDDEVNINRETVRLIQTEELGMGKICSKTVHRNLTEQQRDARLSAVFNIQMNYGYNAASLLIRSFTLPLPFISKC